MTVRIATKKMTLLNLIFCLFVTMLPGTGLPEGFAEIEIADGLDPVGLALAPDGRIFIAEKNGRVLIVRDGELLPDPFVTLDVDNFNERGLQSIVLHPDFDMNNWVYFFYMAPGDNFNRVTRWKANGDFAIPGSEEVLYETDVLFGPNHNGGGMQFGADGKLYLATGDGVVGGTSQSYSHTSGKVLRLNDDGSIPVDNPFYSTTQGKYRAIWSIGLRNPFTMAYQPSTGRLVFCDVGQSLWEEVNYIEEGANYGWPDIEGPYTGSNAPEAYVDPIYAYGHDPDCAIVGGTFYEPETTQFPTQYFGQFFFADYCEGYIKVMNPVNGEIQETFATGIDRPVALLVDQEGALYYLARAGMGGGSPQDNTSSENGKLMKVFYTGSGAPFISKNPQSTLVPEGESVTFEVTAFGADPLVYQWMRNGVAINYFGESIYIDDVDISQDGDEYACMVSNGEGTVVSEIAILNVTEGTRPQPAISTVDTYRAGDTIFFSGTAFDAEDGTLDSSTFEWWADFHHLDHTHPAMSLVNGIAEGFFVTPQIGEISDQVWYRVYLKAVDSEGLAQIVFEDIFPEKTNISLQSSPSGLSLVVDGKFETTPIEVTSVIGIQRSIVAPLTQERGDSIFLFKQWQNGSRENLYQFFADDGIAITAIYEGRPIDGGTGLYAEYFDNPDGIADFDDDPKKVRIDREIAFNWVLGSPYEWDIGKDSFSVRWTGSIIALHDEEYTFYTRFNDGVRLWIDGELLIDEWTENEQDLVRDASATFTMQKGYFYEIKMEYFERKNNAMAILSWSSPSTPKQVIPEGQLFPEVYSNDGFFNALIFPNPVREELNLRIISSNAHDVVYSIYNSSGQEVFRLATEISKRVTNIPFFVKGLAPGVYFLEIRTNEFSEVFPFVKS